MNSFNKSEAAVFSCRLCFLRAFPFISLIIKELKIKPISFLIPFLFLPLFVLGKLNIYVDNLLNLG